MATHFPLMNLPKDIRLCIYDLLPTTTRHVKIYTRSATEQGYVTLVVRSLPVQIFRINKEIAKEAQAILKNRTTALSTTPQAVLSWTAGMRFGGGFDSYDVLHCLLDAAVASVAGGLYIANPMAQPEVREITHKKYYYEEIEAADQKAMGQFVRQIAHY
jgi:hypothetical protein